MIVRRETPEDVSTVHAVQTAAFGRDLESRLLGLLREDPGWVPELSLVAVEGDRVVGHVVCSVGRVGGEHAALGLGPIGVVPDRQKSGVGAALMHSVIGAADALGHPLIALVGDPKFYGRFGFMPWDEVGVPPVIDEYRPYFQVRTLTAYTPNMRGTFEFAVAFEEDEPGNPPPAAA